VSDPKKPAEGDQPSVEETLAWESAHRRRASAGAIAAGLATIVGLVVQVAAQSGSPKVTLLDGFQHANTLERLDLRVAEFQYLSDHGTGLLIAYVLQGSAFFAAIFGVGYLFRATAARTPQLRRWVLPTVLVGMVLLGIASVVLGVGLVTKAHSFAHSADHSHDAANKVLIHNSIVNFASFMRLFGALAFAIGLANVSLNAMRCGLLTRFLGVLGIIAGVLYVLTFGTPLYQVPFVFFMILLGVLIGGHWFNGVPPAWASGKAQPWPSSQKVREQREAQRRERGGGGARGGGGGGGGGLFGALRPPARPQPPTADTDDAGADDAVAAGANSRAPHSSSKKRKRKRR
jgi:hypothetical protein